jgi:hypothetical protein
VRDESPGLHLEAEDIASGIYIVAACIPSVSTMKDGDASLRGDIVAVALPCVFVLEAFDVVLSLSACMLVEVASTHEPLVDCDLLQPTGGLGHSEPSAHPA